MKLQAIQEAISEWYTLNDYVYEATDLLNQGTCFSINTNILQDGQSNGQLHAYPGIVEGKLKAFLIHEDMDTEIVFNTQGASISNHIYVQELEWLDQAMMGRLENAAVTSTDPSITPAQAREHILRWNLTKQSWINQQINQTEGLFEVFVIPAEGVDSNASPYGIFALKADATMGYVADLIVWNDDQNPQSSAVNGTLHDLSNTHPPFPLDRSNFYLLNSAISIV